MRRLAPLLIAAALLAPAAPSQAAHITGHLAATPLDLTTDGTGRFQVRFDGAPSGEFFSPGSDAADAGLQIRMTTGPLTGTVFGARQTRPEFSAFTLVAPPAVVPSPSPGVPAEVQSHYAAGDLVVHEQLQHLDGDGSVRARYTLENPADVPPGPPVSFRAFATADLFSGSDRGAGVLEAGPPRAVGGLNDHFGAGALLEEVTQSEWDGFDTTGFTTIFDRVLSQAGFQSFVDPAFIDNAVGVQWDDFRTNGLADGGQAVVEVVWRFPRFDAITFGEGVTSATGTVNQPLSLPVRVFDGAIPQAGRRVCWSVTGLNPGSGEALTDDVGTGLIPLRSSAEGVDTVTATRNCDSPSGPQRSINVLWSAGPRPATIELSPLTASRTVGETHAVTATAGGAAPGSLIQYSIAGPNAVAGTADIDPATGQGTIRWVGANPGHDTLSAFLDIDGDGVQDQGEPSASAEADWAARPQVPGQQAPRPLTLDDLPNPEPFREVNVQPVAGDVFVRLPGNAARQSQAGAPRGFVALEQAAQIPVGSILETSRGRVALESTADARGLRTQRAQFFDGRFQVRQPRSRRPVTEMVLRGGSFRGCGSAKGARAEASQRRRQGRRVRRVWGDGRGRFRTRGRYSSATVRGTTWLTEDRCGGTLTRVAARPRTNRVEVRDLVRRRTRLLRAGQSYFAARPLGRR